MVEFRKFISKLLLIIILGLNYNCGSISLQKNITKKDINTFYKKANKLFSETDNIHALVNKSYVLLYENLTFITIYKNKYPKIAKDLKLINQYIIDRKTKIIVEKFFKKRGDIIIDKYKKLNFQLVDEFEANLENYLKKIKEINGEVFVGELFKLSTMVKSIKNPEKYIEKIFEEKFLSKEMLMDAISKYLQQLDIKLEENMNRFLVDMETEFLRYLKEIGEIEFLFDPKNIYQPVEKNRISLIYNSIFSNFSKELCPEKIKEEISSKIEINLAVQGGSTIVSFIPGVNLLFGLGIDAATMFYEHKLKKEVEALLDQIIDEIKFYVMEHKGLNLRYKILNFIKNYEENKKCFLKKALISQYKSVQENFLLYEE